MPVHKEIYDKWDGFTLVCPDDPDAMFFKGNEANMISANIQFKIDRCDNDTKKVDEDPCASPSEIDEWVSDL